MDKNKATLKSSPTQHLMHNTENHKRIITRDLAVVQTVGKTALSFREEYGIVDVPTAVSKINKKRKVIVSSYPNTFRVLDKDGKLRVTTKYWLAEFEPNAKEAGV